ncbi:MAG: hypothetical protein L0Z50_09870 [Verrucomicrobiales bacterium]|nr:hypothetical protein [Verrucomicrobiales bacterium]
MPDSSSNTSLGIGFRLNEQRLVVQLQQRATTTGQSVHEIARSLVIQALTAPPKPPGAADPDGRQVVDAVAALRADLSVTLEAVLIAGRILSPDQARQFVRDKLTAPQPPATRP